MTKGLMLCEGTPLQDYTKQYGLWVKREDMACFPPGPAFSKTRGVYARVKNRPEKVIGVLDTYHSQAGHAVARACQILGKQCLNYFPQYTADPQGTFRSPQREAMKLKAQLIPLKAGRSCILYHQARKHCEEQDGYMMPNALKLEESVIETAKEVPDQSFDRVLIAVSSGTIAAGVIQGFIEQGYDPEFILHLGYSRSKEATQEYILKQAKQPVVRLTLIDEGYSYKDTARKGETPPWPCNEYYDLKAFRWWLTSRQRTEGLKTLFWNIG